MQFETYDIQVGTCEGAPIMHTVSAEEQQEMHEAGFTEIEIYNYHSTYEDWQKDC